jgi:hypothetical protein
MTEIPQPLLDDIAQGKCLPFVGAGFSLNASLPEGETMPDWPGLAKILASATGSTSNKNGPNVALEYERRFGRVQLIETIRHALKTDIIEPGKAHRAFVQLPFDTIYTTNFDLLLEDSCGAVRKPYRSLAGELQIPFHGGPLTLNNVKKHGDLRHEEHIIATREDYDKFLEKYPVISTHLSAMLITKTALFLGYSLSDPDFNHIREVVRSRLGRFQRMSYIIQFNKSASHINKMLNDYLHVINLKIKKDASFDDALFKFFSEIQDELDTREGKRFRSRRPEIFEDISEDAFEGASRSTDASALLSSSSNLCFVLMPFGNSFNEIYRHQISPAIQQAGLKPLRADDIFSPGSIMEQIRSAIQQSRVCVVDLTGKNPNVLYELGIAQTLGKPTVLLSQDISDLPFDVIHLRVIKYSIDEPEYTRKALENALQQVLGYDRLDEARQLLDAGMIRAAVAILGVLLEHSLRHLLINIGRIDIDGRDHERRLLSMGKMLQLLQDAQIISRSETDELREAVMIRNQAVHHLEEPKRDKAEALYRYVEHFIQNHIKNTK